MLPWLSLYNTYVYSFDTTVSGFFTVHFKMVVCSYKYQNHVILKLKINFLKKLWIKNLNMVCKKNGDNILYKLQ